MEKCVAVALQLVESLQQQARKLSSYSEKDGKRENEGFLFLFLSNNQEAEVVLEVSIALENPSQLHGRPFLTVQHLNLGTLPH